MINKTVSPIIKEGVVVGTLVVCKVFGLTIFKKTLLMPEAKGVHVYNYQTKF